MRRCCPGWSGAAPKWFVAAIRSTVDSTSPSLRVCEEAMDQSVSPLRTVTIAERCAVAAYSCMEESAGRVTERANAARAIAGNRLTRRDVLMISFFPILGRTFVRTRRTPDFVPKRLFAYYILACGKRVSSTAVRLFARTYVCFEGLPCGRLGPDDSRKAGHRASTAHP